MPKALILILCLGFGLGVAVWDIYAPPPQSTAPILKPAPDVPIRPFHAIYLAQPCTLKRMSLHLMDW